MRENSADGMSMTEEYSVSGMPSDSLSKLIKFKLNSEILEASMLLQNKNKMFHMLPFFLACFSPLTAVLEEELE